MAVNLDNDGLDAWKNLQSNSKSNKDKKLSWVVFKIQDKKAVICKTEKPEEKEEDGDKARHKSFTDYLLNAPDPRYGGIDFQGKVFFVSYVADTHPAMKKFKYANSRETIKNALNGISIDLQASSPGQISFEEFTRLANKNKPT